MRVNNVDNNNGKTPFLMEGVFKSMLKEFKMLHFYYGSIFWIITLIVRFCNYENQGILYIT